MILSDREIKLALVRQHVRIMPLPGPDQFSSMSIDLTLDDEVSCWEPREGERPLVSPHGPEFDRNALMSERGRLKAGTKPWIDGTFGGPDAALALLAFHLHRLGAAAATVVTFVADGAPWIWDRLDWVQQRVGLTAAQVRRVLDWCHAWHHVSLALAALGLTEVERRRWYSKRRRGLRRGWPGLVIRELQMGGAARGWPTALTQPLGYLTKHLAVGHLAYGQFRRQGLPRGSGAVESAIRRVSNLRLKGPGLMWLAENAAGALVGRAAAVTGRWEETLSWVREELGTDRQLGWAWASPDMVAQLKAKVAIQPPEPQQASGQGDREEAA